MTPSYKELDADSSKQSFAVVSGRNSAQLHNGGVSTARSTRSAEAFFERQVAGWAERYRSVSYLHRRRLVAEIIRKEVLRLNRPARTITLLDFGCGSGVLLKDAAGFGVRATGVDNSAGMIKEARTHLASLGTQVILEWLQSSSGEGKYEREDYDIVLCLSVLEFVPDVGSLLSRLCPRVAKGGILVVSVPNRYSRLRSLEAFIHRHPRMFRCFSNLQHLTGADSYLNYQNHQLTRAELLDIFHAYGMTEEDHRYHVAPSLLRGLEELGSVGMMLMAVFRKP